MEVIDLEIKEEGPKKRTVQLRSIALEIQVPYFTKVVSTLFLDLRERG